MMKNLTPKEGSDLPKVTLQLRGSQALSSGTPIRSLVYKPWEDTMGPGGQLWSQAKGSHSQSPARARHREPHSERNTLYGRELCARQPSGGEQEGPWPWTRAFRPSLGKDRACGFLF